MKNSNTDEQRFLAHFGHLRQIDPFDPKPDESARLSEKILERVLRTPDSSRSRLRILYIGVSAAAAVILLFFILKPRISEVPNQPVAVITTDVMVSDLPEMDELLIREVVMESLNEDEDPLSLAEGFTDNLLPVSEELADDYMQYLIEKLTLHEIIQLLIHDHLREQ